MRRGAVIVALATAMVLAMPALALAHDAPENDQSKWVMADWLIETFFIFAGLALVAFVLAWRAGHFHGLEEAARIPLMIEEEDYYSPAWALDEEEWDDVHADR